MLLGQTSSRGHSAFCLQAVVRLQFRQPSESPPASTPTEGEVLGHQMLVLAVCLHPCIPISLYPFIPMSLHPYILVCATCSATCKPPKAHPGHNGQTREVLHVEEFTCQHSL